ncbi:MAG: DUF5752 family protein [Actinobacteria bacterium]|nr:DUF5752 family protein [Actinomycetota bacterium]
MREFAIKDCALAHIATGRRAQTLRELRDILRDVHPGCIYHHFWGTLMRPQFSNLEYNNDFASWCFESLHDSTAAERLSAIDPADYANLEDLRQELLDVIESRLDETELILFTRPDQQFSFVRSVIVVFDTYRLLADPAELAVAVPQMSVGSIFYHFIDARRRDPVGIDDFRAWLCGEGGGYEEVCRKIAEVDPYFESLHDLRARLTGLFARYFGKGAQLENRNG